MRCPAFFSQKLDMSATALNFFLTVVDNMRPAVTGESVLYLVYICFKVLFLQILDT